MKLPFLDRVEERARLKRLFSSREGTFAVLYGRRRCGKSRLLHEVLPAGRAVYYVGDDRQGPIQRAALAAEIGRLVNAFDRVHYPEWDALLARFWDEATPRSILVLDEFPALVSAAREFPSLLQKRLDQQPPKPVHLVIAGSSQRLMQGLVLDRSAPLFGRATAILPIAPLPAGWIRQALHLSDSAEAIEAYAVWGGVPRYWELAADHAALQPAIRSLVLNPLGVLYDEPSGLLLEDLRETTQAASLLSLIARGCHRLSEIAARLEKPATSLVRPMQRLLELDLIARDTPFGAPVREAKRSLYKVSDPFLRFWFRYVDAGRSRLEAGQIDAVHHDVIRTFAQHVSGVWEDLARASVARLRCFGREWRPAQRWWGAGLDRAPMELDVVAETDDRRELLLGEARWGKSEEAEEVALELRRKAERFPLTQGRRVHLALWLRHPARTRGVRVFTPDAVLRVMR